MSCSRTQRSDVREARPAAESVEGQMMDLPIVLLRPPDKCVLENYFLYLIPNICCEHPKHMLKLIGKKIFKILCT